VLLYINPTAAVTHGWTARVHGRFISFIFLILLPVVKVIWTVLLCVMLRRIVLPFLLPLLIYSGHCVGLLNLININLDVFIIQ
jgi:hypothetical protein